MVSQQIGLILWASERFDPLSRPAMALRPGRARNGAVGNIANKHVPERVLALAGDGAAARTAHELASLERVHAILDLKAVAVADRRQSARPEDLSHDCGVLEQLLVVHIEGVEPRGDDPLHGSGKLELLPSTLGDHACELLGVKRVSTRALEQQRLHFRREHGTLEQRMYEARGLLVRKRRERDRRRVRLAAAPARSPRHELRSRSADDEDGDVGEPVHEVIDEVEESVVGPVQVLEDEYERALLRERLEEPPPRRERLTAAIPARLVHYETDERPQV